MRLKVHAIGQQGVVGLDEHVHGRLEAVEMQGDWLCLKSLAAFESQRFVRKLKSLQLPDAATLEQNSERRPSWLAGHFANDRENLIRQADVGYCALDGLPTIVACFIQLDLNCFVESRQLQNEVFLANFCGERLNQIVQRNEVIFKRWQI